jgi:hypothetical protein
MFDLQRHGRRVPMRRTAWARRQQRTAHCSIMQSRARQGKHTTHCGNAALVQHTTISDSPAVETRHEVRSVTYSDDGKALRATRATLYDIMQHSAAWHHSSRFGDFQRFDAGLARRRRVSLAHHLQQLAYRPLGRERRLRTTYNVQQTSSAACATGSVALR